MIRRSIRKLAAFILLAVAPVGCASVSGYPDRSADPKVELTVLQKYWDPAILTSYDTQSDAAIKKTIRDEIVNGRVRAIDLHFGLWEQAIAANSVGLNTASDIASLALTTAATATGSTEAKTVLSAIATVVTGAKVAIDKEVFYDKTIPVLLAQMVASRKEVLVTIRSGLSQPVTDYPLVQALGDVDAYYESGTIPGALGAITATAGAATTTANTNLKIVATFQKDATGDRLLAWWEEPDGSVDTEHDKALKAWLKTSSLGISPYLFIRGHEYQTQRSAAIKDLAVP